MSENNVNKTAQAASGQAQGGNASTNSLSSDAFDEFLIEVTDDYLSTVTITQNPDIKQIKNDVLARVRGEVDAENAVRPKGSKWKCPQMLTPAMIERIILRMYPVCTIITLDDNNDQAGYGVVLGIYQYDGDNKGIYDTSELTFRNLIRKYNRTLDTKKLNEIITALKDQAPRVKRCRAKNLIAVNNGIFNYDTKQLLQFNPYYVFTSKIHVNFNPNAKLPVIHNDEDGTDWDIESWMHTLSDDQQVVDLLWQIIGAIVRPNVPWGKMAWFYSESGNNGKGTLCELMRNLVGEGSYAALSLKAMNKDFMLEPLTRACCIIVDENGVGTYIDDAANLKALVTGDVVQINRKFKQPIAFKFHGFMVQCLNEMPRIKDKSDSFYRRQLFVPFEISFTGHERKYIKYDYMHRPDVLEYTLWRALVKTPDYYELSEPDVCKNALEEYKTYNDPVRQFAEEELPLLQWDLVPWSFLYDLFSAWYAKWVSKSDDSRPSRAKFKEGMVNILKDDDTWYADKDKQYKTGAMMSKPELLIREYDLKDWYNKTYNGKSDLNRLCMPSNLSVSYRGLIRRSELNGGGSASDTDDDDE